MYKSIAYKLEKEYTTNNINDNNDRDIRKLYIQKLDLLLFQSELSQLCQE